MSKKKKERRMAQRAEGKPMPEPVAGRWAVPGIIVLGVGYILTSLSQMNALIDYQHYRYLFQGLPEFAIQHRYTASWLARFAGLALGVGLLFRREIFRKAILILAWGTIATAYWKHPHEGFVRHIRLLSEQMADKGIPFSPASVIQFERAWNVSWMNESSFAWLCVITIIVCEVGMALGVIFFLTRKSTKAAFR